MYRLMTRNEQIASAVLCVLAIAVIALYIFGGR